MDIERPICSSPECPNKNPVRRKGTYKNGSPKWGKLCGNCHRKATGQRKTPGKRGKVYNRSAEAKSRIYKRSDLRRRDEFVRFKQFDIQYRGGCQNELCSLGSKLPYYCYDYHHIDLATKELEIADVGKLSAAVKSEVVKCSILCACCHRLIHNNSELVILRAVDVSNLLNCWLGSNK